jgi:hypothetical protein
MMMARRADESSEDGRAARKAAVALNVALLVGLARAFRTDDGRGLRLDPEVRNAQMGLIRALRLACADGIPLEELRARFIEPVGRESRRYAEATGLLTDTVRLVERHVARRA